MVDPVMYFNARSPVSSICFWEDKKHFIMAGTISGEIKVWDLANCNELQTIESFSTPILWMAVFNLDKLVVQARFDFQVKVFIFKDDSFEEISSTCLQSPHNGFCYGDINYTFVGTPSSESSVGSLTAIKLLDLKDRNCFLVAYESAILFLCDFTSHKVEIIAKIHMSGEDFIPFAIDFDSVNMLCAIGGSSDEILILKLRSEDNEFEIVKKRKMISKGVSRLSIRKSDRQILIGGGWDGTVKLFSWVKPEKLKPLGALKFHTGSIDCVCSVASPLNYLKFKGNILAAGSKDGKISLWSLYN